MTNKIIEGISVALNGEFGDAYKIYANEVKQGLEEPCFFVFCIEATNRLFFGNRYFREHAICVQYFPSDPMREEEECAETADRLLNCLEWITVDGDLMRGSQMRNETSDGVLSFFVNYDLFVRRETEPLPVMEALSSQTNIKNER